MIAALTDGGTGPFTRRIINPPRTSGRKAPGSLCVGKEGKFREVRFLAYKGTQVPASRTEMQIQTCVCLPRPIHAASLPSLLNADDHLLCPFLPPSQPASAGVAAALALPPWAFYPGAAGSLLSVGTNLPVIGAHRLPGLRAGPWT